MEAIGGRFLRKRLFWACLAIPLIFSAFDPTMIEVTAVSAIHDIAVVSVTPNATNIEKGEFVGITVVVENQGNETETFNVTVYYDTTTIGTQNVSSLADGANTSLTFVWNTTDVWIDTLTGSTPFKITATASTVAGETDTADNTLVSPSRVRILKSPYIAVFPESTVNPNLTVGTTYTVSIKTDYSGSDITGWQFTLNYNPNVLHGVNVINGDLITTDKDPSATFMKGTFNNTEGTLSCTIAFFFFMTEPAPLTSGPGTLANVTFEVVGVVDSSITLGVGIEETKLKGYTEGGYGNPYDIIEGFVDSDQIGQGYFCNSAAEVIHDVAVISVTPDPTSVESGEVVNITVVVENQGTVPETFDVRVYRYHEIWGGQQDIQEQTISSLAAGATASLTFIWDTWGVRPGKHIITAKAEPVPGETDTEDNTLRSEETVTVHTPAIYIRADGSIDPPTTHVSTVDNITYTFTADIIASIVVERDNIVVDGAGYALQGRGSGEGIDLTGKNNVTIKNMRIEAFFHGICLLDSSSISIFGSNITNNVFGIWLWSSSSNSISGNRLTNNNHGIRLAYSSNNNISGNKLTNSMGSIDLYGSSNNTIYGNNITNNNYGITLFDGSFNNVSRNNITANKWEGIRLIRYANRNNISRNNIANNECGIYFDSSFNNSISGNNMTNNYYGIGLSRSSNNSIYENNIANNVFGIWLLMSPNNTIYHNNFINNTQQAYDESVEYPWAPQSINTWDDGYPSGGNYWSDHTDADLCSGPYQNETGSDGIWDHPYTIDANNTDRYPLAEPWTPTTEATVDIYPDTLNLRSKGKWITAHIVLPENNNARDVDASTILIDDSIPAERIRAEKNLLIVKFDRQAVNGYIRDVLEVTNGEVTLTITGKLTDGTSFEGKDTVKVIFGGDADLNGIVELTDFYTWRENIEEY